MKTTETAGFFTERSFFIAAFILLGLISCNTERGTLKTVRHTCEYQSEEAIVATRRPLFGWQLESLENNLKQSAYAVRVYAWEKGKARLVWDSGKIDSDRSQQIQYGAENPLLPGKTYFRQVKVWDDKNRESAWSEKEFFRIVHPGIEENAFWIGAIHPEDSDIPEGRNYHALSLSSEAGQKWRETHPLSKRSIYLRKEFTRRKKVSDAILYICGLGHYELSLNGRKVGDAQFNPMWSDYDKTVYYNVFNVTRFLQNKNAIGVLLGNGFFNEQGGRYAKMQVSFGPPVLFFKMIVTYHDGTVEEIVSDRTWKYAPSPVVFNDMYGGEDYDARLEQSGWDRPEFDESEWHPVVVCPAPSGTLTLQTAAPVKILETFSPESVEKVGDAYLFDMGQNLSGFPAIKVSGRAGDRIRLTVSENLHEDGSVNQSQSGQPYYYEYTLGGEGIEEWQPRFSYYGYKFIQVNGAKPKDADDDRPLPVLHDLQSCFVYNSTPPAGEFRCSNELFNRAHRIIVNAVKSNMQAVFTDCPHREKLGWLEQVHLNGEGLFYNFDLTRFAPKIMRDIRDAQLPNGLVPDIAPEYVVFQDGFRDSPEWGSAAVFLPFIYYEHYGDSSLIVSYYDVMKKYVDYLTSTATGGIVSHGLGDWCDYRKDEPYGVSKNTPVALSASVHYYMTVDRLVQAAEITGHNADYLHYSALRQEVKEAFNRRFFDDKTKRYATGSQASNAMPLFAGMVEPQYRQTVLDRLVEEIEERGCRLSTGDVGNRYLFRVLADNGLNELMYKMHNHYEVPGYGFQLQFGATTLTELWDPRAGASWNHFMMGQIEEWFYKSLAGINSEGWSGFRNLVIAPQPVGDLTFVEASYNTLYGKVRVHWKKENGMFVLNLSVPANCSAKVRLPQEKEYQTVGSGNHSFTRVMK